MHKNRLCAVHAKQRAALLPDCTVRILDSAFFERVAMRMQRIEDFELGEGSSPVRRKFLRAWRGNEKMLSNRSPAALDGTNPASASKLKEPLYLTVTQACQRWGVSRTTLYEILGGKHAAAARLGIRAIKLGSRTLVDLRSGDAFFAALPSLGSNQGGQA